MKRLEIKDLTKTYKSFTLEPIHLELEEGMILGLIGANGAGKSTFIKLLLGLVISNGGDATLEGVSLISRPKEAKAEIGFVLEQDRLPEDITVRNFAQLIKPFYQTWSQDEFNAYMSRFNIDVTKKIKALSKGMRMKIQVAAALCHNPKLLLLDEPLHGLDPVSRIDVLDEIQKKVDTQGTSVIISSHITSDLDKCADYVAFLESGKLVFHTSVDELIEETCLVKGARSLMESAPEGLLYEPMANDFGITALSGNREGVQSLLGSQVVIEKPTLEDIMIHKMKGERK